MAEFLSPSFNESAAFSAERRSNWSSFKHEGIPESAIILPPTGNGIDIIRPADQRGYMYEDDCFSALTQMFPDHFILGAHLVDYMLGKDNKLNPLKKPDAIFLKEIDGKTIVSGLSEFKLFPFRNFDDKLDGFSELLRILRAYPKKLPKLLSEHVGNYITYIPEYIYTPPDGRFTKLQVTLVTPPIEPGDDRTKRIYKRPGMHINTLSVPFTSEAVA